MEVDRAHVHMVGWGMVLGEVVGQIPCPCIPIELELSLLDTVSEPVEAHVHGLGAFLFDGVIQDAITCCIIGLDGRGKGQPPSAAAADTPAVKKERPGNRRRHCRDDGCGCPGPPGI